MPPKRNKALITAFFGKQLGSKTTTNHEKEMNCYKMKCDYVFEQQKSKSTKIEPADNTRQGILKFLFILKPHLH